MVLPKLVILLPQVGVAEYLVGFSDSLKLLVCSIVTRILVCMLSGMEIQVEKVFAYLDV